MLSSALSVPKVYGSAGTSPAACKACRNGTAFALHAPTVILREVSQIAGMGKRLKQKIIWPPHGKERRIPGTQGEGIAQNEPFTLPLA